VRVAPQDDRATVRVNDETVAPGTFSHAIALNVEDPVLHIEVADTLGHKRLYTVVIRQSHDVARSAEVDIASDAVAVSGEWMAIDVPNTEGGGSVHILRQYSDHHWQEHDVLVGSNTEQTTDGADRFGAALALDGDLLVVGASAEDGAPNSTVTGAETQPAIGSDVDAFIDSGAVYVFRRQDGQWRQEAYLKAANADARDAFGRTVALHAEQILIGAPSEASAGDPNDNSAASAGAVYVFGTNDNDGSWSQQAYIKASNAESYDLFGSSLAVGGDRFAVGAWGEDSDRSGIFQGATAQPHKEGDTDATTSARESGAAYIYARDTEGAWYQETYLASFQWICALLELPAMNSYL